jgi:hypothetical protein
MRVLTLVLVLAAAQAMADGGTVRAREAVGPFTVTVFTAPQPPAVGPLDVSVLVQDANDAAVLDADVGVRLTSADGGTEIARDATRAAATNKLLYAAVADVPAAGTWTVDVDVRRGDVRAAVTTAVPVGPASPALRALWPYLALPPVGLLLFALHQTLSAGRRGVDRTSVVTEDAPGRRTEDLDG